MVGPQSVLGHYMRPSLVVNDTGVCALGKEHTPVGI